MATFWLERKKEKEKTRCTVWDMKDKIIQIQRIRNLFRIRVDVIKREKSQCHTWCGRRTNFQKGRETKEKGQKLEKVKRWETRPGRVGSRKNPGAGPEGDAEGASKQTSRKSICLNILSWNGGFRYTHLVKWNPFLSALVGDKYERRVQSVPLSVQRGSSNVPPASLYRGDVLGPTCT